MAARNRSIIIVTNGYVDMPRNVFWLIVPTLLPNEWQWCSHGYVAKD